MVLVTKTSGAGSDAGYGFSSLTPSHRLEGLTWTANLVEGGRVGVRENWLRRSRKNGHDL